MSAIKYSEFKQVVANNKPMAGVNLFLDLFQNHLSSFTDVKNLINLVQSDIHRAKIDKNTRLRRRLYSIANVLNLWYDELLESAIDQQGLLLEASKSQSYRYLASFKITPYNIRHIRGYHLLLEKGKYNKDSNPNGVVKDHMISIKYGEDNSVDPQIIGHIMNCEFLSNIDNLKKSSDCSLSLMELNSRIKKYENKVKRMV
jgi:hypothetical protein